MLPIHGPDSENQGLKIPRHQLLLAGGRGKSMKHVGSSINQAWKWHTLYLLTFD